MACKEELKDENHMGARVVINAQRVDFGQQKIMFQPLEWEPIGSSLLTAIEEQKLLPNKKKYGGLMLFCKNNEHYVLLNPELPAKYFNAESSEMLYFSFRKGAENEPLSHEKFRIMEGCEPLFFFINQSRTRGNMVPVLKFSHPDMIRVDGYEREIFEDMICKDPRFMPDLFAGKHFKCEDGPDPIYGQPLMKNAINKKILVAKQGRSPAMDTKQISYLENLKPNPPTTNANSSNASNDIKKCPDYANTPARSCNGSVATRKMDATGDAAYSLPKILLSEFSGKLDYILEQLTIATRKDWTLILKEGKERKGNDIKKKENDLAQHLQYFSSINNQMCSMMFRNQLSKFSKFVGYIEQAVGQGTYSATCWIVGTISSFEQKEYVVIMTNHHVLVELEKSWSQQPHYPNKDYHAYVDFEYENPNKCPRKEFFIMPDYVFARHEVMDYALLCLEYDTKLIEYVQSLGENEVEKEMIGLGPEITREGVGTNTILQLIGHPQTIWSRSIKINDSLVVMCDPESEIQIAYQNSVPVETVNAIEQPYFRNRLYYHCNSFYGASGSPCFAPNGLVSMHCAGIPMNVKDKVSDLNRSVLELGIPLYLVVQDIFQKFDDKEISWLTDKDALYRLFPQFKDISP